VGFNGATPMRTWKLQSSPGCAKSSYCFNGATPMRTWKPASSAAFLRPSTRLQWGHAHEDVETAMIASTSASAASGFNGATPMRTWKPRMRPTRSPTAPELQWGHAHEDVETVPTSKAWGWAVCVAVCERDAKTGHERSVPDRPPSQNIGESGLRIARGCWGSGGHPRARAGEVMRWGSERAGRRALRVMGRQAFEACLDRSVPRAGVRGQPAGPSQIKGPRRPRYERAARGPMGRGTCRSRSEPRAQGSSVVQQPGWPWRAALIRVLRELLPTSTRAVYQRAGGEGKRAMTPRRGPELQAG